MSAQPRRSQQSSNTESETVKEWFPLGLWQTKNCWLGRKNWRKLRNFPRLQRDENARWDHDFFLSSLVLVGRVRTKRQSGCNHTWEVAGSREPPKMGLMTFSLPRKLESGFGTPPCCLVQVSKSNRKFSEPPCISLSLLADHILLISSGSFYLS